MGALADANANDNRRNIDEIFAYVDEHLADADAHARTDTSDTAADIGLPSELQPSDDDCYGYWAAQLADALCTQPRGGAAFAAGIAAAASSGIRPHRSHRSHLRRHRLLVDKYVTYLNADLCPGRTATRKELAAAAINSLHKAPTRLRSTTLLRHGLAGVRLTTAPAVSRLPKAASGSKPTTDTAPATAGAEAARPKPASLAL